MKKIRSLNNSGFAHWLIPLGVVIIIGVVGFSVYSRSHHQAVPPLPSGPSTIDTVLPNIAFDFPRITNLYANKIGNTLSPNPNVSLSRPAVVDDNWTGYSITGGDDTYTMAEADVPVPNVSCPSATQAAVFSMWVGLDGLTTNSTSVEQDGIVAQCTRDPYNCNSLNVCSYSVQPYYYAWTEMYPDPVQARSIPIKAGDIIHMEVSYNQANNKFDLYLHNLSLGNQSNASYTENVACPEGSVCHRDSAEWISENHITQANWLISSFGQVTVNNAEASTSSTLSAYPFSDWHNYPLDAEVNNAVVESVNTPINETVNSFTITQQQTK